MRRRGARRCINEGEIGERLDHGHASPDGDIRGSGLFGETLVAVESVPGALPSADAPVAVLDAA